MGHRHGFRIFWSGKDQDLLELLVKDMMGNIARLREQHGSCWSKSCWRNRLEPMTMKWCTNASRKLLDMFPLRLQDAGQSVIHKKARMVMFFVADRPDRSFEDIMNLLVPEWRGRATIPGNYQLKKCYCGQLFYAKAAHLCSVCRGRKGASIYD